VSTAGDPTGINQHWPLDFVSDALTDSRRSRILAVIDDFSRDSRELDRIAELRGYPCLIALTSLRWP
jgi:putative transposase